MTAKKIIVVSASWEEASKYVKKAVSELAKERGFEVEFKEEDYEFLDKYGVKNEYGGIDIPQVFIQDEEGVKYVMSRVPLNERGQPDVNAAKKIILEAMGEKV
ncbi:MAG: hypothetical protein MRT15_02120 [archaeon YNP-LCB-003-016]|jgi:hypothetical protein|uniref:hypothetical protein n=1 Tax=Candidatus Culexarchaeum yellowstonense TaxID=2928963 RepID=UPI0026F35184|nr:hypothetical protein [Candidatus Culexarchaeum yellowstonense]MCR6691166.1 hypothetical protein [Candidatus Culexarchaeum yellowstonense]